MTLSPRWKKVWGDARAMHGRLVMMVIAVAVGILGVTAIVTAYAILTREIQRNYLGTRPADAIIELDAVQPRLLDGVRRLPGVVDAQAGDAVLSRVQAPSGRTVPLLLFVVPDFNDLRIGRFMRESGSWPPPTGSVLLERTALGLLQAQPGQRVLVQAPNGSPRPTLIAGAVHDPALAPATQEQTAYGYVTPATLAWLGQTGPLHLMKVVFQPAPANAAAAENGARTVAAWLGAHGATVHEIRIPPPGRHPHQNQMTAILRMLMVFSVMALVLAAILIASMVDALLTQQVRQIGIMKAIGASSMQIALLYATLIAAVSCTALVIGMPLGLSAGREFARAIAHELNFTLYSESVPAGLYLLEVAGGLLIPLLIALIPIVRAIRVTVRVAISDLGISRHPAAGLRYVAWLGKVPGIDRNALMSIRNTMRRRGRLALTLGLLACAGAMFMTSMNVKAAWERNLAEAAADRHHDLEIRLNRPEPADRLLEAVRGVDGVASAEAWNVAPAAPARPDGLDIVRTYPDGGHGSFSLRSVPLGGAPASLKLLAGRWLRPDDVDAVVLNHVAHALMPDVKVGQRVALDVDGRLAYFLVVGLVREIITPASAYTTPEGYARATNRPGQVNAIRLVMSRHDADGIAAITRRIGQRLDLEHVSIKADVDEATLARALSGHVYLLVFALGTMAVVMAVVGILGLMSAMSTSVFERTREFGILRAIGATRGTVIRNVVVEGLAIGLASWCLALLAALPLSSAVGQLVGKLAFQWPLSLTPAPLAIVAWFGAIVLGSLAACAAPARSASGHTVRNALSCS